MTPSPANTIGLLYAGDMGSAIAAALLPRGWRIVSTADGRSDATARRSREAGVVLLDSVADVVRTSHIVITLVPPAAAADVAAEYCRFAHLAPPGAMYVDANSICPELAIAIADQLAVHGVAFVDAAINGLANKLSTGGTLFLSGARADHVAAIFTDVIRTRAIGPTPGRASAMKMLLSTLSKGVCALFVETALLARRQRMLPEFTDAATRIYPGIMALAERMLPTYADHAARRADEMRAAERTAASAGVEPCILAAVRDLHERVASTISRDPACGASAASLIEHLAEAGLLAAEELTETQRRET